VRDADLAAVDTHLVGDPASPRLVSRNGQDLTEKMLRFARAQVERPNPYPGS
jgi:hypothetical protein